ncbi:MAG: sigma-70 family RNA polymerase sigma factor [Bacteroidota bacterium]|nr:sigma-70 family RNA polymerase sigma factor [Bacteroidota bacterium]
MIELKKMTDTELVTLYKSGEIGAFKVLYNRYKSKVFTTIYFIVKDKDLANDLTQDIFCKVVDTIKTDKYQDNGKFKQWVVRMAHNLAIDNYRRAHRYQMVHEDDDFQLFNLLPLGVESTDKAMLQKEIKELLKKHIQLLPQEQKEVLIMRHFADMSFKEIAAHSNISINTALGRMRYALLNLRKMLTPYFAYEQNYYP